MALRSSATWLVASLALGATSLVACGGGGIPYAYLTTPGGGGRYVTGPLEAGSARLKPDVCRGVPEDKPESEPLDATALVSFLERQGLHTNVIRERPDLVYVDVTGLGTDPVRLRVAILPSPYDAGSDLHHAILQHGPGSWGVHRSNLAVLAPIGSMDQIMELAGRTKLACWGVLTVAALDDDFVVPGGYMEF